MKNYIKKERNDICYLYNYDNMRHIILTKEVYNYIKEYRNFSKDIFLEKFENINDREYMNKLLDIYNNVIDGKINKEMKSIYFSITNKCNLSCIHCCSNSVFESESLSLSDYKIIIDNIEKINPDNLIISGGEPLICTDFFHIINYVKEKIPSVNLILSTNGTLVSNENVKFIVDNFDSVEISLDGYDDESVGRVRGADVFSQVINSINLLKSENLNSISVSMVFGEKNIEKMDDFIEFNKDLKTYPLIRYFNPEGRGYENYMEYTNTKSSIPISVCYMYENFISKGNVVADSCDCYAYLDSIFINHDGIAYPCTSLINEKFSICNFKDEKFKLENFILKMNRSRINFINKYMKFQKSKCENCDINIFCWKCPAIYINALNNNEINLWCSKMKKNIEKIIWDM